MRHSRLLLSVVISSLVFAAALNASEPAPTIPNAYPRSQGEIKAILQMLAAKKGGGLQNEYLSRLKQYRYLVGVPYENLQWDEGYAELAQAAAGICAKLNKLTHNPEHPAGMSDAEYDLGKRGAGQTNLFMGVTRATACVDGWMDDSDPSNIDRVGHRRWCINPSMGKSAFGTTGNYAAMYAFDKSNNSVPDWDYVAYPTRGYMPTQFFGSRHAWSVSINPAKYATPSKEQVKVTLTAADAKFAPTGTPFTFNYFNVNPDGFGTGTAIIFRPEGFSHGSEGIYLVEITGLKTKKGEAATITYPVHFINLQKVQDSPESAAIYTKFFNEKIAAIKAMTDKVDQLEAYTDLSQDEFLKSADTSVNTGIKNAITELVKDAALRKEQEASQRYKIISDAEQKAGKKKDQRVQVAFGYRDLSQAYKDTRAGKKAASDFERLKAELQ